MTERKVTRSQPTDAGKVDTGLAVRSPAGPAGMFDELFRPFDEFFLPRVPSIASPSSESWSFRQLVFDVHDRGDHISVTVELPGFNKDEVTVRVDSSGLEVRADRTEREGRGETGTYQRNSRSYYQHLSLPDEVVAEKVEGSMKNGILDLKLPKRVSTTGENARRVDLK